MTSMNRARYRTAGALAAAGLLALACSSDSTAPKVKPPPDLASIFGEMSGVTGLTTSSVTGGLSSWASTRRTTITPSACTYSPSAQDFACPPLNVDGITFTRTYALYDAAGHPQSHPDANTASVRMKTTMTGTTTLSSTFGGTSTLTIDRHDDRTLSGINTGQHVLNSVSAGTTNDTDSYGGSTHTLSFTDADTTLAVALPAAGSGTKWPQSGSVRSHSVGTDSFGGMTFPTKIDMIMTFDGNNMATLVVTTDGFTTTCKVDLSNPRATSSCTNG